MLSFTSPLIRKRIHCRSAVYPTRVASFHTSGVARSDLPPSFVDVAPADLELVQRYHFANKMAEFKDIFDKPCIDTFSAVFGVKRKLVNKKAKHLASVGKKPRQPKLTRLEKIKKDIAKEEEIEKGLQQKIKSLRDFPTRGFNFASGKTPEERRDRERFFRLLTVNAPNLIRPESMKQYDIAANDTKIKREEEIKLSTPELGLRIARELEEAGFVVHWDRFMAKVENAQQRETYDLDNHKSFLAKAWRSLPQSQLKRTNIDPDRPLVLKSAPHDPRPKPVAREVITKVGRDRPIAFETTHAPGSETVSDPMRTRKVSMYIKVASLGLPKPVRSRLLEIAGPDAYEHGKDLLIIKSQKHRSIRENRTFIVETLRRMLAEAWKVDLNFLPTSDIPMLPHNLVEEQIMNAPVVAEQEFRESWQSILETAHGFKVFRLPIVPVQEAEFSQRFTQLQQEIETL